MHASCLAAASLLPAGSSGRWFTAARAPTSSEAWTWRRRRWTTTSAAQTRTASCATSLQVSWGQRRREAAGSSKGRRQQGKRQQSRVVASCESLCGNCTRVVRAVVAGMVDPAGKPCCSRRVARGSSFLTACCPPAPAHAHTATAPSAVALFKLGRCLDSRRTLTALLAVRAAAWALSPLTARPCMAWQRQAAVLHRMHGMHACARSPLASLAQKHTRACARACM